MKAVMWIAMMSCFCLLGLEAQEHEKESETKASSEASSSDEKSTNSGNRTEPDKSSQADESTSKQNSGNDVSSKASGVPDVEERLPELVYRYLQSSTHSSMPIMVDENPGYTGIVSRGGSESKYDYSLKILRSRISGWNIVRP